MRHYIATEHQEDNTSQMVPVAALREVHLPCNLAFQNQACILCHVHLPNEHSPDNGHENFEFYSALCKGISHSQNAVAKKCVL